MNQIIKITFQKVLVKQGLPYKKNTNPEVCESRDNGVLRCKGMNNN